VVTFWWFEYKTLLFKKFSSRKNIIGGLKGDIEIYYLGYILGDPQQILEENIMFFKKSATLIVNHEGRNLGWPPNQKC
jgi:hypothetical protein